MAYPDYDLQRLYCSSNFDIISDKDVTKTRQDIQKTHETLINTTAKENEMQSSSCEIGKGNISSVLKQFEQVKSNNINSLKEKKDM